MWIETLLEKVTRRLGANLLRVLHPAWWSQLSAFAFSSLTRTTSALRHQCGLHDVESVHDEYVSVYYMMLPAPASILCSAIPEVRWPVMAEVQDDLGSGNRLGTFACGTKLKQEL